MNMALCKCSTDSLFAELKKSMCFGNGTLFIQVGFLGFLGNGRVCSFSCFSEAKKKNSSLTANLCNVRWEM